MQDMQLVGDCCIFREVWENLDVLYALFTGFSGL